MELATFAKSSEKVSRLGFGCWGIGKTAWIGADDKQSKKLLLTAIEKGVTLFDTAYVYGRGHSERLVGEAEKISGKKIFIASKIPSKKYEWPAYHASTLEDSFPTSHIISMTETSLKNLGRDYLDLQQFHVWNDSWASGDSWKEAIYQLKKQGKVRYFGISMNDHQSENGIEAGKTGLIDCFQVIFNIFEQSPTEKLFPFCKQNKISILARVPLDEGGLTGNIGKDTQFPIGDFRNNYFTGDRRIQVEGRIEKLRPVVSEETASMAEAALRYVLSFEEVTAVIPGMRTEKNLLANMISVMKGSLSQPVLEQLKLHSWHRNFYSH